MSFHLFLFLSNSFHLSSNIHVFQKNDKYSLHVYMTSLHTLVSSTGPAHSFWAELQGGPTEARPMHACPSGGTATTLVFSVPLPPTYGHGDHGLAVPFRGGFVAPALVSRCHPLPSREGEPTVS